MLWQIKIGLSIFSYALSKKDVCYDDQLINYTKKNDLYRFCSPNVFNCDDCIGYFHMIRYNILEKILDYRRNVIISGSLKKKTMSNIGRGSLQPLVTLTGIWCRTDTFVMYVHSILFVILTYSFEIDL